MPAFLQRYLGKSQPEDIAYADFEAFLKQNLEEHQTLEYKSGALLVDQAGKLRNPSNRHEISGVAALAKAVAGLANAEGGLLVVGVEEKEERARRGGVIRIRPGRVVPVPGHITREIIENAVQAKIQFRVEGLTIRPLRKTPKHQSFVYLIDVPQSTHPPHRVNEIYYYQRYNFSTEEMKHYQIADLYGRRLGPSLDIETDMPTAATRGGGTFTIIPRIRNRGNVVAKYVMVICRIIGGEFTMVPTGPTPWVVRDDNLSAQFNVGLNGVVYPDTPMIVGPLAFGPTGAASTDVSLEFLSFAEGMEVKSALIGFLRDALPAWPTPPETIEEQLIREAHEQQEAPFDER